MSMSEFEFKTIILMLIRDWNRVNPDDYLRTDYEKIEKIYTQINNFMEQNDMYKVMPFFRQKDHYLPSKTFVDTK